MSPLPPITATVGGKVLVLVRNPLSRYRYGTLGDAPVNDYAARVRIAWASDSTQSYPSPDALAAALTDAEEPALFDAVDAMIAPPDAEKKSSSPSGHSPESTSG
jgi:hypothetical protein